MTCETGTEKRHLTLAGLQATIDQRVTNTYRKENGTWKVLHHHADISASMMDVLVRLKANA